MRPPQPGAEQSEDKANAVHRLNRDEWWLLVRRALDGLSPADVADYRSESRQMDGSSMDGREER